METGNLAQAENEYYTALKLLPNSALFQLNWAQVALERSPSSDELKEIITMLNQANIQLPSALGWILLSRAYALNGEMAYSTYAAAQYSLYIGESKTAQKQLKRAKKLAQNNPTLILKIEDLERNLAHNHNM